jgi:hypothetical protein
MSNEMSIPKKNLALENHYLKAQKMYISKMNSAAGADKI